jgi:hypothetical protein
VWLLGQIRGIRELSTRKGDTFLSVALGMLDGETEIVVWPNVLETSRALWEDGKFVSIEGQIRERDGRVSVAVNSANEYHMPADGEPPKPDPQTKPGIASPATPQSSTPQPSAPIAPTREAALQPPASQPLSNGASTPAAANENGSSIAAPKSSYHTGVGGPSNSSNGSNGSSAPAPVGGLVVRMTETTHPQEDRYHLEDLVKTLLDFQGEETVTLEIKTDDNVVKLELPFVNVRSCPELTDRLTEMVGAANVRPA